MHKICLFILSLVFLFNACHPGKNAPGPKVEEGVSAQLAADRKASISHIHYKLDFDIPREKTGDITATETLQFLLLKNEDSLQLDFKEDIRNIQVLSVNGKSIDPISRNEHLLIATDNLKTGDNQLQIKFKAGNAALNRRDDYLYTLFVPDRARTAFPCFDQPDLKAVFTLTLHIPEDWQAIAVSNLKDSIIQGDRKTMHFADSDTLSTYLFSFTTGKFKVAKESFSGKEVRLLYRETDSSKIQRSVDSVFSLYKRAINYYEQWTGIHYPFQKYGMVAIPDFQFGGMEHPGAILFQSSTLFLGAHATQDQSNIRSNLIAHETAHMWFGDMVTMKWFSDVWMKEVFANFMADKSTGALINKQDYALKFLTTHYPAAYNTDRTPGANPIRQQLDNLENAGMLYGNIIYHKAPIMMRQLELLMGKDNFQKGVREYLGKYAYGNASWPDLITILDKYTTADLQNWNKVWVNETGRPEFDYSIGYVKDKIGKFIISQHPEYGKDKVWPQTFDITLYYRDSLKTYTVAANRVDEEVRSSEGARKPLYIIFNSSGIGYGVFPIDTVSLKHITEITNPVTQASLYISSYENMLDHRYIKPEDLLKIYIEALPSESSELNLKLLTGYISNIFWDFLLPAKRGQIMIETENAIWQAMKKQDNTNKKKLLFMCYQNIFGSRSAFERLYSIWKKQLPPADINLSEDDYTTLACSLALRDSSNALLLQEQLIRIKNIDRIQRFRIIMPALSSDPAIRDRFFNELGNKANRTNESAITAALYYLYHPLRQKQSIKYLQRSLELLAEIQKTGDIFFPDFWLQATFSNYQSEKAMQIVSFFLKNHPDYNPVLKAKILQATDNLRRSLLLQQSPHVD